MQNEIKINKNFDEMNKNFLSDKKLYQIVAIIMAFIFCGVFMIVLKPYLGTTLCSYLSLFISMPLGFIGMYEKHGIDFLRYMKIKKNNRLYGKLFFDFNIFKEEKIDERHLEESKTNR